MTAVVERLYQVSPIFVQQGMVAAYGWWWYRRRFGSEFRDLVAQLKEREQWTAGQFRRYQEEALAKLFRGAWNSPYYRRLFTDVGLARGADPFESLRRIPSLSKETLRVNARELLTRTPPKGTISFKSSGTTGTPTEIYYTREFHALETAASEARSLSWAGLSHAERRVMFGVRKVCRFDQNKPPFWRLSPAENMAYASVYHLSESFLQAYVSFLRRYRPAVIMGYPSALNTIASYVLRTNDEVPAAKGVFTTSETLTDVDRVRIEAAFGCRVYDRYSAVEMSLFASQCEFGRYHVSPDIGIVQLVDSEDREVPPGVSGEVVCTGLQNTLQPLIRYRIGDIARWATDQRCPCGRAMPILESIEGRFEDVCYTADGREILRFDTVFKGIDSIREAQVVQEKLNRYRIYVIPASGFDRRDVETITQNMTMHVGHADVVVTPVDAIERSASGKFRAVICRLSPEERARFRRPVCATGSGRGSC